LSILWLFQQKAGPAARARFAPESFCYPLARMILNARTVTGRVMRRGPGDGCSDPFPLAR